MKLVNLRTAISRNGLLIFAALGLSLVPIHSSALNLEPYSLRVPWYIEGDGQPYWEVRVTCSDKQTRRFIVQYDQFGPWCLKQARNNCHAEKIDAAFEVCSGRFDDILAEQEKANAAAEGELAENDLLRERLRRQQASLQQQRRNLNSRKLQLERREQELQQRKRSILERQANLQ